MKCKIYEGPRPAQIDKSSKMGLGPGWFCAVLRPYWLWGGSFGLGLQVLIFEFKNFTFLSDTFAGLKITLTVFRIFVNSAFFYYCFGDVLHDFHCQSVVLCSCYEVFTIHSCSSMFCFANSPAKLQVTAFWCFQACPLSLKVVNALARRWLETCSRFLTFLRWFIWLPISY